MGKRTWEFNANGNKHTVELIHNIWSGRRKILVDGQIIEEGRKLIETYSHYYFTVDQKRCEVGILSNNAAYIYFLLVDNEYVPAIGRKPTPKKRVLSIMRDNSFWFELAAEIGLGYIPFPDQIATWRHRLIGYLDDYFIVVRHGQLPSTGQSLVGVLVRYAALQNPEVIEAQLIDDQDIKKIRGKAIARKETFEFKRDHSQIAFYYDPKKDISAQISDKVLAFVKLISGYVRPLPNDICEGANCRFKFDSKPELVFVNNSPQFLCENCISEIPTLGEKLKAENENEPLNLLPGLLVGIAGALLGGIIWALMAIYLTRFVVLVPLAMVAGIIAIMRKVGTRITLWSTIFAGFLSAVGVLVGNYLMIVILVFRDRSPEITLDLWIKIWQAMWAKPALLYLSLLMCLLILIKPVSQIRFRKKYIISKAFKPDVEIVKGFTHGDSGSHN